MIGVGTYTLKTPMTQPARARTDVSAAYNRWAAIYDADKNATRDLDAFVLRRVPVQIENLDVLELGSGTGKNTEFLAARARSVIAMDVSEGMIARAHQRIPTSNVRFILHDVRDTWPVKPASVDAVVANLILEHVHDLAPVFFEAARVLRPGGQFFFCELHPYRQLAGSQAQFVDPDTGETVQVDAHVHTVSEYVNGAIEAGFSLISLGEWKEDGADPAAPPRLISLLLERA
jgi:ubiquinone/menaquinone biosynthesis C-methylase UbiE